jgi:hypothetical protein
MGKTVGHVAIVGGLALPVIAEVVSLSQSPHGFKWDLLSVLALILLALYVIYAVIYVMEHREKEPQPTVAQLPPNSLGANRLVNTETGRIIGVNVDTDVTENSGLIANEYPPGTIGIDHRGGTATYINTDISGLDRGVQQTGGELRSEGLRIDGESHGEKEEGVE